MPKVDHRPERGHSFLFPGEDMVLNDGFEVLVRFRKGDADKPLIVFLPGGGHLARVAYGHPSAQTTDFLDHWLSEKGFSFLALSYPCDHPAFARSYPGMTSSEWSRCAAEITQAFVVGHGLSRSIMLVGWSMAGKILPVFSRRISEFGLQLDCFISLAATPPFPGLARLVAGGERLTKDGLWDCTAPLADGSSRVQGWIDELERISDVNGRCVIPPDVYRKDYRCATPIQLRGEAVRLRFGKPVDDLAEAVIDLSPFDFSVYPPCGAIIPSAPSDGRHALTDRMTWGFFNAQAMYETLIAPSADRLGYLADENWQALQHLMRSLPDRLCKSVEGGHLFFVGGQGARATANYIETIIGEIQTCVGQMQELTSTLPGRVSGDSGSRGLPVRCNPIERM